MTNFLIASKLERKFRKPNSISFRIISDKTTKKKKREERKMEKKGKIDDQSRNSTRLHVKNKKAERERERERKREGQFWLTKILGCSVVHEKV